jgi:hypothetical protein
MDIITEIETRASADLSTVITLSASDRTTAMETWLHTSWDNSAEYQYAQAANTINGGSGFTMKKGTISSSGAITDSEGDGISTNWLVLGFNQLPGWNAADPSTPTGLLDKILTDTSCFPWANFIVQDATKNRYIIIVDGKIFRHEHSEGINPKVNLTKIQSAKNAVKDYATAEYHSANGNSTEAAARTTAAETTINDNEGDGA